MTPVPAAAARNTRSAAEPQARLPGGRTHMDAVRETWDRFRRTGGRENSGRSRVESGTDGFPAAASCGEGCQEADRIPRSEAGPGRETPGRLIPAQRDGKNEGKAWQAAAASRPSDDSVLIVRGIRPRACGSAPIRPVRCGRGAWPRPSPARRSCGAARKRPGAPCVRSGGNALPARAADGKCASAPRAKPVRCGAGVSASVPRHTGMSGSVFLLQDR